MLYFKNDELERIADQSEFDLLFGNVPACTGMNKQHLEEPQYLQFSAQRAKFRGDQFSDRSYVKNITLFYRREHADGHVTIIDKFCNINDDCATVSVPFPTFFCHKRK